MRWLWSHYLVSQRRVCGLMGVAESSVRYRSGRSDEALRERLKQAAREKPRWGYRRLQIVLDQTGEHVNHKRIYRVYREAGLAIRRRARKRLLRVGSRRPSLSEPNQEWALDFVHDAAESGRKFRALSVVDPYTRECLALEVDTSMGSRRVTRVLEGIIAERGLPQAIRSDNGPRFGAGAGAVGCRAGPISFFAAGASRFSSTATSGTAIPKSIAVPSRTVRIGERRFAGTESAIAK
ncbi:MAG: DDE-type integrase/transposase/recombinase [Candidatus Acidiferrales bacterium]